VGLAGRVQRIDLSSLSETVSEVLDIYLKARVVDCAVLPGIVPGRLQLAAWVAQRRRIAVVDIEKPGDANALAKPGMKCPCLPMPPRREAVRLNTAGRYRRPLRALQAQAKHAPVLQASGSLQGRADRELVHGRS
jgi:hypothetical protein